MYNCCYLCYSSTHIVINTLHIVTIEKFSRETLKLLLLFLLCTSRVQLCIAACLPFTWIAVNFDLMVGWLTDWLFDWLIEKVKVIVRRVITKNISFQIAVFPVGHDKVLGLEKGLYIKNVSILNAYFQIQALVSYPPPPPHPSKVELLVSSCLDTLLMGYTDYHCHYCKLWGFMFAF